MDNKHCVLIVDDEVGNLELFRRILSDEYEILTATNGQEALDCALEFLPDLILLDVVMPGMDGFDTCHRLKGSPLTKNIPVIFITTRDREEDEAQGLDLGAIDYLTKPVRSSIVRARVRNHLELKRYQDFLENLSATDGLTGITNRRGFDEQLDREWRRELRDDAPLSLIMLDLDFFKAFNDHYGHLAGDDCLRQIAQALNATCQRPADLVARYGGEEFACLLPDTDAEGAAKVAQNILENVRKRQIPHAFSVAAAHVTVSMGVMTILPTAAESRFDLIKRADELLYHAKDLGRNQIKTSGQEDHRHVILGE